MWEGSSRIAASRVDTTNALVSLYLAETLPLEAQLNR